MWIRFKKWTICILGLPFYIVAYANKFGVIDAQSDSSKINYKKQHKQQTKAEYKQAKINKREAIKAFNNMTDEQKALWLKNH